MVRVPGDLASYERYRDCFDFINCDRQYILTPVDVKIYTVATAFTPSVQDVQFLSIEQSSEKAKVTSLYSNATRHDSQLGDLQRSF